MGGWVGGWVGRTNDRSGLARPLGDVVSDLSEVVLGKHVFVLCLGR